MQACTLFSSYVTADEASWDFEIYANWDHVNPDIYAAIGFSAGDTEMGDVSNLATLFVTQITFTFFPTEGLGHHVQLCRR